jgi:HAD superfamily hydrolase (TIGR01459 family)
MNIPVLSGLRAIAASYDGYLLDLWGTLHDGAQPLPGALDCLRRLRRRGARIILLSNAPRRAEVVIARLEGIGIPRELYDEVVSSGEMAYRALQRNAEGGSAPLGRHCLHIGPERDDSVHQGTGFDLVDTVEAADFLLNTGVVCREDTVVDYEELLCAAAARRLPMLCANPDRVVLHRGRRELCAGALAERYAALGGEVRSYGKPHAEVYEVCLALFGTMEKRRILAIGDSLYTDIAGAAAAGIDSLFITSGIHAEELSVSPGERPEPARIEAACERAGARPVAILPHFIW